jgi:hypothetical protein
MPLERDSTEAKCDKKEKGRFKKLAKKIQKAALAANNNAMDSNEKVGLKVKTNGISSYKEIKECIRMGLKVRKQSIQQVFVPNASPFIHLIVGVSSRSSSKVFIQRGMQL